MAILRDNLKRVTININVGNVVKSVGRGIYKDKSKIKTETDKEIVKKKSKIEFGRGTIIINNIEKTNITTPISVTSLRSFKVFLTLFTSSHPYYICKSVFFNNSFYFILKFCKKRQSRTN